MATSYQDVCTSKIQHKQDFRVILGQAHLAILAIQALDQIGRDLRSRAQGKAAERRRRKATGLLPHSGLWRLGCLGTSCSARTDRGLVACAAEH